jgi:hypothetical protein
VHVDAASLSGNEPSGRCELDDGAPLALETARRLACDASIVRLLERDGRPLTIGRKTRSIPPALRRALRARSRLPLPRLRIAALPRRPPHRALGARRPYRP